MTNTDKVNKYQNGKIYAIRSFQTDKIYIGSTTSPLHKRYWGHLSPFRFYQRFCEDDCVTVYYMTSFEILKYADNYIELIEYFPCNTMYELHKREGEIMRDNINLIVNKNIPTENEKLHRRDNSWFTCVCGNTMQRSYHQRHCKTVCKLNKTKVDVQVKPTKQTKTELERLEEEFENIGKQILQEI